jgi:hypothetical protein
MALKNAIAATIAALAIGVRFRQNPKESKDGSHGGEPSLSGLCRR